MSLDLYNLLKLKDRSQRLYVKDNPHIYIYGDLIMNIRSEKIIDLTKPTSIGNSLCHQLGAKPGRVNFFEILDCYGRKLCYESTFKGYDRTVLELDDNDYLIKTHTLTGYINWVYRRVYVTAEIYDHNNTLLGQREHKISDIKHIIYLPKVLDYQK